MINKLTPKQIETTLKQVTNETSFIEKVLVDLLGWPIDPAVGSVEPIAYPWTSADLRSAGLDGTLVEGRALQIANLDAAQPWGIFILEFKRPDAFLSDRGLTGALRNVLRGLVESRVKDPSMPSWRREHLLFICTHDCKHFRFAYFKRPPEGARTAPLAAFGWGPERSSQTALRYNLPHLAWPDDPTDAAGWVDRWTQAFDVERVTTKFYTEYKALHDLFVKTVRNVSGDERRKWIASVVLNRLMFVYFLQRRGFLDNADARYLENRFAATQKKHSGRFYLDFLTTLFFNGFATPDRSDSVTKLIGDVRYLNGGLFVRNGIEVAADAAGKPVDWPDDSFRAALDLFARYSWNLDDAASGDDNEINPDVLGYIFERYINDRADMGAYYTKEDITDYIAKNTILPFLLDRVAHTCPAAFSPGGAAWRKLAAAPSRYIYPSVRRGVLDAADRPVPLPDEIAAGEGDVAKRAGWNRPAPAPFGLPTETWREHVARRQRCLSLHAKLAAGGVSTINELITLNLDVTRFTLDLIADPAAADANVVDAFATAIETLSVLDPTCGSGAFLFAALNLLASLYDACLSRMDTFVEGFKSTPEAKLTPPLRRFRATVARVNDHASRGYFVAKTIVVNNLYGVDLMPEAVDICKLRLFLRLVGQVDRVDQVEPLPDIDFNVQAGNTLVGFASLEEVNRAISFVKFDFEGAGPRIAKQADAAHGKLLEFQAAQAADAPPAEPAAKKKAYRDAIGPLRDELDGYLATQNGIVGAGALAKFRAEAMPFHWCADFFGQMTAGGFDVIIGNPPYVSAAKIRKQYDARNYRTARCTDIYAWCLERVAALSHETSRTGMIVPLSLAFSGDFAPLRTLLFETYGNNWFSSFGRIPAALFAADVRVRNTIHLGSKRGDGRQFTTRLHRWFEAQRPSLIDDLSYAPFDPKWWGGRVPKLNTAALIAAFERAASVPGTMEDAIVDHRTRHGLHFKKTAYNWLNFCRTLPPCFDADGAKIEHTKFGEVFFKDAATRDVSMLLLNGKLQLAYWVAHGDDFDVTRWMFGELPIDPQHLPEKSKAKLAALAEELDAAMKRATSFKLNAGKRVGNYNLARCRDVTDKSDRILAKAFGFDGVWEDIELLYEQFVRTDFEDVEE